jgi:hypothetical protein
MDDRELYQHFVTLNEKVDALIEALTDEKEEEDEEELEKEEKSSVIKRFKKKEDGE